MKKIVKKCMILLIVSIMFITAVPVTAQAANKNVIPLKSGKTYTSYDFTGDGKRPVHPGI